MKYRRATFQRIAFFSLILLATGGHLRAQKNTNFSKKLQSGIFTGGGNVILSNTGSAFIGGGTFNTIATDAPRSAIAGGFDNATTASSAFIGAGENNLASGPSSAVAGGRDNTASNTNAFVGGGTGNTAGNLSSVGGGFQNVAGDLASVGGGVQNVANGSRATIGGGDNNTVLGFSGMIGGGVSNSVTGRQGTIPGGSNNVATNNSFAAGANAKATNSFSFVWSGTSSVETTSTNTNSFTVRAPGGARFITATNLVGASLAPGATAWAVLSDSNAKMGVAPVAPREILAKVAALPVTSWSYKHDPQRRYIGPMAQDFHAAFGLGSDDKTITTLDTDGVTLAAIQGLVEELSRRDAKIAELEAALQHINERLDRLPPAP